MNNLIIEKIWQDEVEPFGDFVFIAESKLARVKTTFYESEENIIKLSELLEKFATNQIKDMYWDSQYSQYGSDIIEFYIKGFYTDSAGHICFEIFAEIQDNKYYNDKPMNQKRKLFTKKNYMNVNLSKHQICFYVNNIEPQSLIEFSSKLKNIQLNEEVKIVN